jgi:pimeloyl-ACP methyl ester carboxylesterase
MTWRLCVAVLLLVRVSPAFATMTQLPGLVREPLRLAVTLPDGTKAELEVLVTRPDGPGRFPLAMINHGLPRNATAAVRMTPETYSSPAIVYAQHGYAAVVVNRRGFGLSSESIDLPMGPCGDRDYTGAARAQAVDILAALASLREEPWVDPDHVILVGHSLGGLAALAAATDAPAGLTGIINFAGLLGSAMTGMVCSPQHLVATMHELGAATHIPSLWIFAQNDGFFGPAIARQTFDAYTAAGAPAEFDAAPPYGHNGHLLIFSSPPAVWWPRVAAFLDRLHLPTRLVADLPPLADLPEPPNLDARGKQDLADYVHTRDYEKAFATDGKGHYGSIIAERTQEDAEAAALAHCKSRGWNCKTYAVGNTLIP